MTEEIAIALDRKHRALRSADRWAVQIHRPDGTWDLIEAWDGGRRSLLHWCEDRDIVPSREAEAALERLPESAGFRERS